jgi:hypothetical protein
MIGDNQLEGNDSRRRCREEDRAPLSKQEAMRVTDSGAPKGPEDALAKAPKHEDAMPSERRE